MSKPRRQERRPAQSSSKAAAQPRKTSAQRKAPPRRTTSFWRGPGPLIGSLGGIIVLVVLFILVSRSGFFGGPTGPVQPKATADPAVLAELAQVSPSVIDSVGTGGQAPPLSKISGPALTGSNGKAEFLYVGAEWCPYCAAERWAMAIALDHFGTLSGVGFTTSSSSDVFPDTHTLAFYGSSYSGAYLDFVPVELQDRNRNNLQAMNAQQQQLFQTYNPNGDIPFLDFGNQYSMVGQGVHPDPLQGLSWQQIGAALSNPNSPVTQAIVGNSNYLTAAICKLPGTSGASVCSDPVIQRIETQLPR